MIPWTPPATNTATITPTFTPLPTKTLTPTLPPTLTPRATFTATVVPTPAKKDIARALIISFDGLRPDAIELAPMPNLMELMKTSAYSPLNTRTIDYPATSPSHASMLSGLCIEDHGVIYNKFFMYMGYSKGVDIFDLAHEAVALAEDEVVADAERVRVHAEHRACLLGRLAVRDLRRGAVDDHRMRAEPRRGARPARLGARRVVEEEAVVQLALQQGRWDAAPIEQLQRLGHAAERIELLAPPFVGQQHAAAVQRVEDRVIDRIEKRSGFFANTHVSSLSMELM